MKHTLDLDQFLGDLEYLVNIDSQSSDPEGVAAVAAFFEKAFAEIGWKVEKKELDPTAGPCLKITNGEAPYDALLLGHMDTVFPRGTVAERPFTRDEKRAYGPGVNDMKGGLLFSLYAARALEESKAPGSFCIAFNSEEEIGSRRARPWIEELARQSRTALIMEPARPNGDLTNERKGLGQIRIEFHGRAAHAGVEPEKGVSAVNEMAHWISALHGLTNFEKGTTLNAGVVAGGTAPNVVPEKATMAVDVRIKQAEEKDRIGAKVEELKANPATPGIKVDADFFITRPPMNPSPETMKLCALVEEAGREAGVEFGWQATGGGSDGNFTAALGVPTVDGMGPVGGGSHAVTEYMEIDQAAGRFALLMNVLERIPSATF
ncbi:MAG: M20 family metallopeptidase [Aminivibrio sp.]|jgi:glutamate carboxypeptidase